MFGSVIENCVVVNNVSTAENIDRIKLSEVESKRFVVSYIE